MKKVLILFILLTDIVLSAWAYDFSAQATSGQTLFYNIDGNNVSVTSENNIYPYYSSSPIGDLEIPNSVTYNGQTFSVTTIGNSAFYNCTGLTSITIPNSVTTIEQDAFSFCEGLTSITIPNSVTTIGNSAFLSCTGLTSITIPNSVTTIGNQAFSQCTGLTSITIPNSVTTIANQAFSFCTGLTSITIPNSVTTIGSSAFYYCTGLTSVTIPNSVTYLSGFSHCTGLTSITIPNSVTTIEQNAFSHCTGLTSVTIPNSVTYLSGFSHCTGLTSITIPNSVTTIEQYAFSSCTGLTSITIPNSVTTIEQYAFSSCTGLTSITIPNSVTTIELYAFSSCTGLTSVTIPNSVTYLSGFDGCEGLTSITIPNSVTTIGNQAFYYCTGLTSITIPNSVTTIEQYAFSSCTGLTSITIPNSVITIGKQAFQNCSEITSAIIGNSVTSIGDNAFNNCIGLTSITIPNSVITIGNGAFQGCSDVTSAIIGNSVTTLNENAFFDCTQLSALTFKRSQPPTIGNNVFYDVPESCVVYVPCGSLALYIARLTDFYNFVEESIPFTATSIDTTMGEVLILTEASCTNPIAVLQAVPNNCYRFDHWNTGSTDNPYTLNVTDNMTVTAYFVEQELNFTAESENENMGTVQILTEPTCSNPNVVLNAIPNNGYHFEHWSTGSTDNPYSLNVTDNMVITAYFVADGVTPSDDAPSISCVTVDQNNHNVVRWEPRDSTSPIRYNIYREGLGGFSIVGYVYFNGASEYSWVDDISNVATQSYSYKLSEVYADNSESDLSTIHTTIHLQISQGQGNTMNLSWTPYVGFDYVGYRIYHGTSPENMSLLTTLAVTNTTYSDINGTPTTLYQIEVVPSSTRNIAVSSRSNIISAEAPTNYTLNVQSADLSMGSVAGGDTYLPGEQANIIAMPFAGYHFTNWSDGSTQDYRTITVTGDATYIAYFASNQPDGISDAESSKIYIYTYTGDIMIEGADGESIQVYDIAGRMVYQVASATGSIKVSVHTAGTYIVRIGDILTRKVVVTLK